MLCSSYCNLWYTYRFRKAFEIFLIRIINTNRDDKRGPNPETKINIFNTIKDM